MYCDEDQYSDSLTSAVLRIQCDMKSMTSTHTKCSRVRMSRLSHMNAVGTDRINDGWSIIKESVGKITMMFSIMRRVESLSAVVFMASSKGSMAKYLSPMSLSPSQMHLREQTPA